eukprot:4708930-Amphidinium_carterae.1
MIIVATVDGLGSCKHHCYLHFVMQAINGTAVAHLLAATTAAEADGGSKWPEYGARVAVVQACPKIRDCTNPALDKPKFKIY